MKYLNRGGNDMTGMILEGICEYSNNYVKEKEINTRKTFMDNLYTLISFYNLKRKLKKQDYSEYIEKNDNILGGKAVIKGTRIEPKVLYDYLILCIKKSETTEEYIKRIKKEYPALKDDHVIMSSLLYYVSCTPIRKLVR